MEEFLVDRILIFHKNTFIFVEHHYYFLYGPLIDENGRDRDLHQGQNQTIITEKIADENT